MSETRKTPWYRLHALTWLSAIAFAALFLLMNVVGQLIVAPDAGTRLGFGWPSIYAVGGGSADLWWSWRLLWTQLKFEMFDLASLAADIAVATFLWIGTVWAIERWCRRFRIRMQFGIRWFLAAAAAFACGVRLPVFDELIGDVDPFDVVIGFFQPIAYVALFLTWLAIFDWLGLLWNWLKRRSASAASSEV